MAFDPLSWAIGYALKKGLLRLLTHKSLASNLQTVFKQWANNLPPDAHIYPDSDFAAITPDTDPAKQPSLYALRNTLLDNHIPTESQWLDALLEQWRLVSGTVEEPQKFFKLQENTARQHLARLAKALANECKKHDSLFKVGTIDEIREANKEILKAGKKLDVLDGKINKINTLLNQGKTKSVSQPSTREIENAINGYLSGLINDIRKNLWEKWFDIFAIPITIYPGDLSFDGINAISNIRDKKILLHGKPASGKTTAIERIMVTAKDQSNLIPVRLFATDGCNASALMQRISYKLGLSIGICKELEKQGRFLFIFDALNQEPKMKKVTENIRALSVKLDNSKFLITCRTYEYETNVKHILRDFFIPYEIKDLSWDDQKKFIERRICNESQKQKLLLVFESHPKLKEVCANQFAFLMAIDAIPRAEIPPRLSSDLYELFFRKFIAIWERTKDIKAKRIILEEVAYALRRYRKVNKVSLDEERLQEELFKASIDDVKNALNSLFKNGFLKSNQFEVEFFQETCEEFLVASWLIRHGVFPKHFTKDEQTGELHYEGLLIDGLIWQFYLELGGIVKTIHD